MGQPASINDREDFDEELNSFFKELSEELQIDSDISANEYSNFNHEVCTSFPSVNSDEVGWRHVSVTTCIQEYGAANCIAIKVENNDNNDEQDQNENDISQIIPREAVNLADS